MECFGPDGRGGVGCEGWHQGSPRIPGPGELSGDLLRRGHDRTGKGCLERADKLGS